MEILIIIYIFLVSVFLTFIIVNFISKFDACMDKYLEDKK